MTSASSALADLPYAKSRDAESRCKHAARLGARTDACSLSVCDLASPVTLAARVVGEPTVSDRKPHVLCVRHNTQVHNSIVVLLVVLVVNFLPWLQPEERGGDESMNGHRLPSDLNSAVSFSTPRLELPSTETANIAAIGDLVSRIVRATPHTRIMP